MKFESVVDSLNFTWEQVSFTNNVLNLIFTLSPENQVLQPFTRLVPVGRSGLLGEIPKSFHHSRLDGRCPSA